MLRSVIVCFLAALALPIYDVQSSAATEPVTDDADDPAIWVNRANPEQSLVLGTNKVKAPKGALFVFGLDGKIRQSVVNINRPNNVDVEYGLQGFGDIAVVTERLANQLRVFAVTAEGIREAGAINCCPEPMGIGLYRRPTDGAVFAIVAPKGRPSSPHGEYLYQFRLTSRAGRVDGTLVRRFGRFSGSKEIEAVVVDDELGFVYYSDEGAGIRKYRADPDASGAQEELALLGTNGYRGDREGLALYKKPDGTGYLISTDQLPGNSEYHVFLREKTNEELFAFRGGADTTDGIEVTSEALGSNFPKGLFVAMNSRGKNFLLYPWERIQR